MVIGAGQSLGVFDVQLFLPGLGLTFGILNWQASGIQVISSDMVKTQKQYEIGIYTRVFRQPISTKGRVIWQKPYEGKNAKRYYRAGFEFTYFKGHAMEQLEALEVNPLLRDLRNN